MSQPAALALNASLELLENSSLAPSPWSRDHFAKNLLVLAALILIDLTTLVGNLLVVVAVMTTKTLHTVTNSFIVSLACADMLVAIFVMPLSIYTVLYNTWTFGSIICDLWSSCDVMLCTASILNLCCISLDRYFAITRPLSYSRQRSPKLARTMIALVWISSVIISCPPVFGWGDKNRQPDACTLNLLLSYRIYSSMGSFYVPCFIMIFVYVRIFKVIHDREKYLMKSSSSNTTTFSMPNLDHGKSTASASDESACPWSFVRACCCCKPVKRCRQRCRSKTTSTAKANASLSSEGSLSNQNRKSDSLQLPGSQSMLCFGSSNKNSVMSSKEQVPMSTMKELVDETCKNLNGDLNEEEDDAADEEIIKNFSSFINDASNRSPSSPLVKSIATGLFPLSSTLETTTDMSESPSTRANEQAEAEKNNPEPSPPPVLVAEESKPVGKKSETRNSLKRNASTSSHAGKRSSRGNKLMNIDFRFLKESKPAENMETRSNPRIRPNDAVARKLATHASSSTTTTNSILATVTFMPNSRTKFASCLTINRNGSMKSVRSLRSMENNDSIKEKYSSNRRRTGGPGSFNDSARLKSSKHQALSRSKPPTVRETAAGAFSKSSSLSSNLTAPATSNLKPSAHSSKPMRNNPSTITTRSSSGHNHEQMRLLKESKAAKTLAIVVGGFIVSWMPFFVIYVLEAILPRGYISKMLFDWLTWLGYFNSAINPIIYAFYSKQFRQAFYRLTIGKCRNSPGGHKPSYHNYFSNYYYSAGGPHNTLANGAKSYSFYNNPGASTANGFAAAGQARNRGVVRLPNDSFYRN